MRVLIACTLSLLALGAAKAQIRPAPEEKAFAQDIQAVLDRLVGKPSVHNRELLTNHPSLRSLNPRAWYSSTHTGELRLIRGTPAAIDDRHWQMLKHIAPRPIQETITTYVAYHLPYEKGETMIGATVYTDILERTFGIAINDVMAEYGALANAHALRVLLHEYAGHVHFSHQRLLDPKRCAKEKNLTTAFVRGFANQFWQHCANAQSERPALSLHNFVSPYAAKSLGEDIAETATTFVICNRPAEHLKGAADKVRYFWTSSDAVSYRIGVRSRFGESFMRTAAYVLNCPY